MFESVYREMLRLTAYGPADKALRRDYTERLSCCTLHVGLDDLWVLTRTETVPGVSAAGPPPDARFSQLTNARFVGFPIANSCQPHGTTRH